MLLEGRKLLITGVLTDSRSPSPSRAARRRRAPRSSSPASAAGCGSPSGWPSACPTEAEVLELDVNDPDALEAVAGTLDERWGRLDGVLHAIAFVPADALGGRFLETPSASAVAAFETSAFSLKALAAAMLPLLERGEAAGRRRPGLRRQRRLAGLRLGRRLQGRAGVDQPLPRARPRPARRALEPRRRRPAADRGGLEHRGLRGPRARSGSARRRWAGTSPTRRRSPTRACSCSHRWRERSPARSCTSTAACMRWGRGRWLRASPTLSRPPTPS